jgi:hypothetical protein
VGGGGAPTLGASHGSPGEALSVSVKNVVITAAIALAAVVAYDRYKQSKG